MDDQNRNLILASVLSFLVIIVWFVLFPPPEPTQSPVEDTVSNTAKDVGVTALPGMPPMAGRLYPASNLPKFQRQKPFGQFAGMRL